MTYSNSGGSKCVRPAPEGSEKRIVRARVAEAAKAQREYEREAAQKPSELQSTAAYYLGALLGIEVDPLTVRDLGYQRPYHKVRWRWHGLTFKGSFSWGGGDSRYSHCGDWKVRKRWRLWRREVRSAADLKGWV